MFKKKPKARKLNHLGEIDELTKSGRPVLVDFYQVGCAPCQVMDGIFNELAREYGSSAHVVKADIGRMPDAVDRYKIRSTPTMVLLAPARPKKAKKVMQTLKDYLQEFSYFHTLPSIYQDDFLQ
jgi:thioredoxin-like negative regulator of GroEL